MDKKARGENDAETSWELEDVISDRLTLPLWATRNVVQMLEQGNTIPFIARYRKEKTGDMAVDNLREVCQIMQELRCVVQISSSLVAHDLISLLSCVSCKHGKVCEGYIFFS